MSRFSDIAMFSGNFSARASGRSTAMLTSAPKGSFVVAAHQPHAVFLRNLSKELGRTDLKVISSEAPTHGLCGPVVVDHFAMESLLFEADRQINEMRDEAAALKAENAKLKRQLK